LSRCCVRLLFPIGTTCLSLRWLQKYLGQEFVDEQFEQGDAPEFSREAWLKVKPTLDLDFPNLPFFEDGKVKLTQSQTIMRYIARAYGAGTGLYEGTPAELAEIDLMMDQVSRCAARGRWSGTCCAA